MLRDRPTCYGLTRNRVQFNPPNAATLDRVATKDAEKKHCGSRSDDDRDSGATDTAAPARRRFARRPDRALGRRINLISNFALTEARVTSRKALELRVKAGSPMTADGTKTDLKNQPQLPRMALDDDEEFLEFCPGLCCVAAFKLHRCGFSEISVHRFTQVPHETRIAIRNLCSSAFWSYRRAWNSSGPAGLPARVRRCGPMLRERRCWIHW